MMMRAYELKTNSPQKKKKKKNQHFEDAWFWENRENENIKKIRKQNFKAKCKHFDLI